MMPYLAGEVVRVALGQANAYLRPETGELRDNEKRCAGRPVQEPTFIRNRGQNMRAKPSLSKHSVGRIDAYAVQASRGLNCG
jgi:hypothetical protein